MNVSGFCDEQRIGAELLRNHGVGHLRRRHRQREPVPLRNLLGHHEADVVSCFPVLAAGIAQTNNQTH